MKMQLFALLSIASALNLHGMDTRTDQQKLIEAIQSNDLITATHLLELGVDSNASSVNARNERIIPIEVAIHHGPQICQLLISHGAIITPPAYTRAAQIGD